MLIFTVQLSIAVDTCINTTQGQICYGIDSGYFPQNINLFEGANDKYNLYIENPDEATDQDFLSKIKDKIQGLFDTNRVDITELGDQTQFEFQSYEDFYNFLQQENAIGNVSLFTSKDLNQYQRELTNGYTSEVLQWTGVLWVIIIDVFKIFINLIAIFGIIIVMFRLIPFALRQIKKLMYKMIIKK